MLAAGQQNAAFEEFGGGAPSPQASSKVSVKTEAANFPFSAPLTWMRKEIISKEFLVVKW